MPILTIEMGVPLKRPVIVKNPRSEERTNGTGVVSKKEAIRFALEGDPTVICTQHGQKTFFHFKGGSFFFYDAIGNFSSAYSQMINTLICCPREI